MALQYFFDIRYFCFHISIDHTNPSCNNHQFVYSILKLSFFTQSSSTDSSLNPYFRSLDHSNY